jgi:hypothetical protein
VIKNRFIAGFPHRTAYIVHLIPAELLRCRAIDSCEQNWVSARAAPEYRSERRVNLVRCGPESVSLMDGRLYDPSNARARRELGWAPTYSLPHSLAETIDALRTLRRAERRKRMA